MTKRKFDPAACLVVPAVALTLIGVSLLSLRLPSRAETMTPPAISAPAAAISAPAPAPVTTKADLAASSDGDGDELLEHWGDPKYWREERVQLAGMGVFLIGAAAVRGKRALRIRRLVHAANA